MVLRHSDRAASAAHRMSGSNFLSPYAAPEGQTPLRIKKSMPDLRGFNGPVVARDPARSLTPQRSSGNLRDYSSLGTATNARSRGAGFNTLFGAPIDAIPPVPPLPDLIAPQPLRNPRGPTGESRGLRRVRE